jgi:hypothetical protein
VHTVFPLYQMPFEKRLKTKVIEKRFECFSFFKNSEMILDILQKKRLDFSSRFQFYLN